jgi:hypothetical protein
MGPLRPGRAGGHGKPREYLGWLGEQPDHTVLMGATTYRLMAEFAASGEQGVDQALTKLSKVVFSSTLTEPLGWANTDWSPETRCKPCER